MRKASPAICSSCPSTSLNRVLNVKSPKVSSSQISSGKCSSVRSRESCASTGRVFIDGPLAEIAGLKLGAVSRTIFHSPGFPSPLRVLRNPGGVSFNFAWLKSKTRSAPPTEQAKNISTEHKVGLSMKRQGSKAIVKRKHEYGAVAAEVRRRKSMCFRIRLPTTDLLTPALSSRGGEGEELGPSSLAP